MVSIENEIFTILATALRTAYTGIYVTGEYVPVPTKFPCVYIEEADNYTGIYNGANVETISNIMYEINVFSNLADGRKTQCKAIINTIDSILVDKGFKRISLNPVPNEDATIYRMTARYTASVDTNNMIYRR